MTIIFTYGTRSREFSADIDKSFILKAKKGQEFYIEIEPANGIIITIV